MQFGEATILIQNSKSLILSVKKKKKRDREKLFWDLQNLIFSKILENFQTYNKSKRLLW